MEDGTTIIYAEDYLKYEATISISKKLKNKLKNKILYPILKPAPKKRKTVVAITGEKIEKAKEVGFILYEQKGKSFLEYDGRFVHLRDNAVAKICLLMLQNNGKILSNETLNEMTKNNKDASICYLRKAFQELGKKEVLKTKKGKGYRVAL